MSLFKERLLMLVQVFCYSRFIYLYCLGSNVFNTFEFVISCVLVIWFIRMCSRVSDVSFNDSTIMLCIYIGYVLSILWRFYYFGYGSFKVKVDRF